MKKLYVVLLCNLAALVAFAQTKQQIDKAKLFDLYQNQQYNEAANYMLSIYGNGVNDFKVLTQLGYCNLMSGNTPNAEEFYSKANVIQPHNLNVLSNLGNIAIRRGNIEKASQYYLAILEIDSNNFSAYKQLAALTPASSVVAKSNYLKKANKLVPTDADIIFDLNEIYLKMNLFGLAESILTPALAADSNNIKLLKIKLPILLATNKFDDAILTSEKLFSLGDSSVYVLNNLGKAYYLKNEFQKGLDCFKRIDSLVAADDESLFYNMALCSRGLKQYISAANYLKKAIDAGISKNTLLYYTKMGESFEQADKFEAAAATYKKGSFFDTGGNLLYILAQIYDKKLNQKPNAILAYNQALKALTNVQGNKPVRDYITQRLEELKK